MCAAVGEACASLRGWRWTGFSAMSHFSLSISCLRSGLFEDLGVAVLPQGWGTLMEGRAAQLRRQLVLIGSVVNVLQTLHHWVNGGFGNFVYKEDT